MTLSEILIQLQQLTDIVEEKMNEDVGDIFEEDGLVDRIHKISENIYTLNAGGGYNPGVDVLCRLTATGNGFIAHFPSHANHIQDNYICMGFDEADALRKLLPYIHKDRG